MKEFPKRKKWSTGEKLRSPTHGRLPLLPEEGVRGIAAIGENGYWPRAGRQSTPVKPVKRRWERLTREKWAGDLEVANEAGHRIFPRAG